MTRTIQERGVSGTTRDWLILTVSGAVLTAGLIFVGAVLPAEYGVDPFGTGRLLGLTAIGQVQKDIEQFQAARMAGGSGSPTIVPQPHAFQQETVSFTLGPHESIEYKYRLDKGQALLYSWLATAAVNYELHAEPDGAPRGYAESYEKKNGMTTAHGTLTAPFSGIHGWYWENTTDQPATIALSAAGFFNMAYEFRKDSPPKPKMFQ